MILEFGEPGNYSGETWETAHKWFVKRWIGRMALNGNGAISTLLRRNNVAEGHRSSLDLVGMNVSKRPKQSGLVMGRLSNGRYNKFFSKTDDQWVSTGDTVAFGLNGDDNFDIGLVQEIQVVIDSVNVSVVMYNESTSPGNRPLATKCARLVVDTNAAPQVIDINNENAYISLFSVQPDFVDGGLFDCPFMDILK